MIYSNEDSTKCVLLMGRYSVIEIKELPTTQGNSAILSLCLYSVITCIDLSIMLVFSYRYILFTAIYHLFQKLRLSILVHCTVLPPLRYIQQVEGFLSHANDLSII